MRAEIVAIGAELLQGHTINSNAAYISEKLLEVGIPVSRHTVIDDEPDEIRRAFDEALTRSDLVIATGGLGPTVDDVTRTAVDETQAELLPNRLGTAPGLFFREKGKIIVLLPGVPVEMKAMLPLVLEKVPHGPVQTMITLKLHTLHEVDIDPTLRTLQSAYPEVKVGIYPQQGLVNVRLSGEAAASELRRLFAPYIYDAPTLEEAILERFIQKGLTLATAESCTGGSIASALTRVPGASRYFLGSVVAYSNTIKTTLLGVPESVLKTHGAVSQQTVEAMAGGLLECMQSDVAVAVTGVMGPTGHPLGTVWCALAQRGGKPYSWKLTLSGNREMMITQTVYCVLGKILTKILI